MSSAKVVSKKIGIHTSKGEIPAVLHQNNNSEIKPSAGVVMIAGAGGGVYGPCGMYEELCNEFCKNPNIISLRFDQRFPAQLSDGVWDNQAAIKYLVNHYEIEKFVIIGWSFGGAVVLQTAALNPYVKGVITLASQTAGATQPVRKLQNTSLLFIHGTADQCLPYSCSETLYQLAGSNHPDRTLKLCPQDSHGFDKNYKETKSLIKSWACKRLGVDLPQ
ncbi:hypothetical protein ABK040_005948 [Willaertia magna]